MPGTETEAEEVQADFLFLRELGQGASSVRLSEPLSIENSESSINLVCVSNSNGFLFAATNEGFIAHNLSDIRQLCSSSSRKESPKVNSPFRLIKTIENAALGAKVTFLKLAQSEEKIVIGLANGRIAIWSVAELIHGREEVNVMQPPSPGLTLLEIAPNPSDRPELCIALYGSSEKQKLRSGTAVVFNLQSGQWGSELRPSSGALTTSLCWSVKGKQIVLGLDNGNLIQMTPEGQEKDSIPRPASLEGTPYVEHVMWLENHVFFATYNQPPNTGDEDPVHQCETYTIIRDTATKTFAYTHFIDPAAPFGDTARRGHRYAAWLKGWEPTKHMLFVANTSSTEVGLLGSMTKDNQWHNLDLEDTSRPTLPFSSLDQSADTSPVGLDLDFTSESNVDDPQAAIRGEDGKGKLSPMPVLYIYTTDGMLLAYAVVNVDPAAGKYPGMSVATISTKAESMAAENSMQTDMAESATPSKSSTSTAAFTTTPASSNLTPGFGQTSGFGGFGATPAFGQSASIGNKSPSPFSFNTNPSATNTASPSTPVASTGGFGAFASKPSNAFGSGSTSFSFGTPQSTSTTTNGFATAAVAASTPAFGSSSTIASTPAFGTPSTSGFGQVSTTPAFGSSSSFGASTAGSGSTAFGQSSAFGSASTMQKSPFATASSSSNAFNTPSGASTSGFGGFASKTSTFGASSNNDSNQLGSIFGSGGSLQTSDTKAAAPVFGQSANQQSGSLFASNATPAKKDEDEMEDEKGDSGSLSFGGLGGLLGDSQEQQPKASGFTFGSKQDATFSTTPTPSPFSFAKPKESESKVDSKDPEVKDALNEASKEGESQVPKVISAFGTTSAFPAFANSTTPTSSPLKVIPNGEEKKSVTSTSGKTNVKEEIEEVSLGTQSEINEELDGRDRLEGDDKGDASSEGEGTDEEGEEEVEAEEEEGEGQGEGEGEEEEEEIDGEEEAEEEQEGDEKEQIKTEVRLGEKEQIAGKSITDTQELEISTSKEPPAPIKQLAKPTEAPRPAPTPKIADPEELVKGSLQDLFLQTYLAMEKELAVLKENTQRRKEQQMILKSPNEKALQLQDLSDETKWTFGDLETKSKLTLDLIAFIDQLESCSQRIKLNLREIQSSQLKADIKREEIGRFIRARNDPSFNRLVRIKQLGPEHADNQSKLRKASSVVREGIEELEAFIDKARKMTLEEQSGHGQGTLRAPSLDTIRRTTRNITQSVQIRLIELQELEMNHELLTVKKSVLARNVNESILMMDGEEEKKEEIDGSDVFDSIRSLERALPRSDSCRIYNRNVGKQDTITEKARDLRSKHLELKSVFLSGCKEPILNKVNQGQDFTSESFQPSDLNMAFAKGPIRIRASKPVLKSPPLQFATTQNGNNKVDSPTFSFFTKPKKDETSTFTFSPLPTSTLPKDAFQLPPEEAPFAPGVTAGATSRGGHHVSKYGGKRNTAVALPSAKSTTDLNNEAKSKANFFAMPEFTQNNKPATLSTPAFGFNTPSTTTTTNASTKAPLTGFSGFGSSKLGFGNSQLKNTKPSTPSPLASRMGPLTFQGLQPMKPVATTPQVGYDDNDDSDSDSDDNARRESDDGQAQIEEEEREYEDEEGNLEEGNEDGEEYQEDYEEEIGSDQEEKDQGGLSDVQEADEE